MTVKNSKIVIMHNDDVTPLHFVKLVLKNIFKMSEKESAKMAKDIHEKGALPIVCKNQKDAAEKANIVMLNAGKYNFPFKCEVAYIH